MNFINPLDVFLWTVRKNEKDVISLYDSLSPIMQLATGGSMLNFGFWSEHTLEPLMAQENLCSIFGKMAELETAKRVVDVGSGLSAPALFWRDTYPNLQIFCVNINYSQLTFAGHEKNLEYFNSSSTKLPFTNSCVDCVLALESAQHFKPLENFILEAKRILKSNGLFVIALPITMPNSSIFNLGILKFTWSSEQYGLEYVKNLVRSAGFSIEDERLIGKYVYPPLTNYYLENRSRLKNFILKIYPTYVEKILYSSLVKMKKASEKNIIDYVVLKCRKK